jgi:hypothetical protein
MTTRHGYQELRVPYLVTSETLTGTGGGRFAPGVHEAVRGWTDQPLHTAVYTLAGRGNPDLLGAVLRLAHNIPSHLLDSLLRAC